METLIFGIRNASLLLGYTRGKIEYQMKYGNFPIPVYKTKGVTIWDKAQLLKWKEGLLPPQYKQDEEEAKRVGVHPTTIWRRRQRTKNPITH